ncbi:hypothetical protein PNH38_00455 [Anoxybacillus rupiensis]|uniref:Uncharacterized protein n=1 Tax=Anoxybacteroides rupiense TaxID=311460 RepID=A0ABT5W264_9BACL|nr:hypothetical protein [Anoxybacillus rupiensis]
MAFLAAVTLWRDQAPNVWPFQTSSCAWKAVLFSRPTVEIGYHPLTFG